MHFTKVFKSLKEAFDDPDVRYINSVGGSRSSKSGSAMQLLTLIAIYSPSKVISCVAQSFPMLKRGIIRDFQNIMIAEGLWDPTRGNASDAVYTFPSGTIIEFFSSDSPGKCQGSARDILFINEAFLVPYETARQLFVRTRQKIIVDWNPAASCWINEQIEPRPNCRTIHSTYKDNDTLSKEQIAELESNRKDENWARVFLDGLLGTLEGVIFSYEVIDKLPTEYKTVGGIDFGFQADPTAIVHCKVDTKRKIIYAEEICYRTQMLNSDIVTALREAGCPPTDEIYADCAEPKAIEEIKRAGFNIRPCKKGAPTRSKRITFQIQGLQGWSLKVTRQSVNLLKELQNYTGAKDKEGRLLNVPIDSWNHCFTGDTLVTTSKGDKRIDSISVGDLVLTDTGYYPVERVGDNGIKEVSDYYINGTKLSATSDHRIMTTNGWKQIGELGKDTLFKISMEKDFTNTPENVIIREELANYTELFENIIMGRFRREMKYITSTGTPKTMRSPIYNVSPKKTIKAYTKLRYKRGENQRNNLSISHKSENLHLNGILPKKGGNGIQKTLKALEKRISCVLVRTALKDFIQLIEIPNTAVELVKQPITDITKSNTRMENVYNLQIAVNHKYFANGFLVSNCLDSLRYAIWTKFSNISNGHYALK